MQTGRRAGFDGMETWMTGPMTPLTKTVPANVPATVLAAAGVSPGGGATAAVPGRRAWHEPLVWLVFGIPGLTVVAGIATLVIATQRADLQVTSGDFEKSGMAVSRRLERDHEAARMGLTAGLRIAADGTVTVDLRGAGIAAPARLDVNLLNPARSGADLAIALLPAPGGPTGRYAGRLDPAVLDGRGWLVSLDAPTWRLRLPGAARLDAGAALEFAPGRASGS